MDISRRDALRSLTLLVGGAISAPALRAVQHGLRAEPAPQDWTPVVLTREQAELLGTVVDLIIPPTDTPGAKAAGVHVFVDRLLQHWASPTERAGFLRGLGALDGDMQQAHGVAFREASAAQQQALLTRLDQEALQARRDHANPLPFFATLKEWTLVGYYTSEIGATQELRWLAAPGRYDADVPLREVGRTWA